ncbi:ribosomal protein L7/L12 [Streptomyces sp. FIT100]|uniref:ribosomal protein L7/L12 n=1 Tax=Streptomyces sp. FIT100 TaxID=2837956 RepID=UPI0021CACDC1|nr:ribosomal protein L7/L12 [Streptomyces sp. FIT100]UUN30278.1 ribosomal protein L7/L12 [Streptomyces sp. FIT100]
MYIAAVVLIVGLALLSGSLERRLSRVDRRLARLERKIDRVLDHLGIQETEPRLEQVAALVRDGRKIEAIKVYREITDAGLKEAKDAVDRIEAGG